MLPVTREAENLPPLDQRQFSEALAREQRRTERSRRPFVLMVIQSAAFKSNQHQQDISSGFVEVIGSWIRQTDIFGWYTQGEAIGIIFTEIGGEDARTTGEKLIAKFRSLTSSYLEAFQADAQLCFSVFPDDWDKLQAGDLAQLYRHHEGARPIARSIKRMLDIAGSSAAVLVGAPLFLGIALAIRVTSPGPILFRQQRVGRNGRRFKMLKFRSMYVNNDASEHKAFVKELIAGAKQPPAGSGVFKITRDKRITPVGRFIRRTSLDEIPQFFNVLLGDMSLVGPRPALEYEVESYDLWHRRRLLTVKPGITGPWQVGGRSLVPFDEMVRMDVRYACTWSLWQDIKILAATPRAVVVGAY